MPPTTSGSAYICLPCLFRRTNLRLRRGTSRLSTGQDTERSSFHQSLLHGKEIKPDAVITLNNDQTSHVGSYNQTRKVLNELVTKFQKQGQHAGDESFQAFAEKARPVVKPNYVGLLNDLVKVYAEVPTKDALQELNVLDEHRRPSQAEIKNSKTIELFTKLHILKPEKIKSQQASPTKAKDAPVPKSNRRQRRLIRTHKTDSIRIRKQGVSASTNALAWRERRSKQASPLKKHEATTRHVNILRVESKSRPPAAAEATTTRKDKPPDDATPIDASFIKYKSIETEQPPQVPRLSFDLSRVLFNPGVYHLQDPRSRVYNFDPYLEKIMPVSEFNFEALNPYITSSEDLYLRDVSMKHRKRYIGSSSSMGSAMAHFHLLLSAWRPIDFSMLSRKFEGQFDTFTIITRAPGSIFLRWRNGVYAVDADKEFDEPNILMMQGKSMEKLLTLEKDDFERYRKPKSGEDAPALDAEPEAYHYSTVGKFLLRSQLDAYDPRLPGTGTFDLKTRAVAGIRMNMSEHEDGTNYEIRNRFGMWESYDREYYDMIRSAFLKYSLQVRMGRMDGIFVAYHNIARIFGFQYISVEELDMALHGQPDPVLGDREFKLSLSLLDMMFDVATARFPKQSLRLTFYTQAVSTTRPAPIMRFFIEPLTEQEVTDIQKTGKQKVEDYERNMMNGIKPGTQAEPVVQGRTIEEALSGQPRSPSTLESSAPDTEFLNKLFNEEPEEVETAAPIAPTAPDTEAKQVLGFTLDVWNEVNGRAVLRPNDLRTDDKWVIKHRLEEMDASTALAKFNVTRNRRSAALAFEKRRKGDYFGNMIQSLNNAGRSYRIEQDQLDAVREQKTLYDLKSNTVP